MSLSADDRKALWDEIAKLELDLEEAVQEEDYSAAASLRDTIKETKRKDPYCRAEEDLEAAISGEQYDEAARLRNVMKEAGKPPVPRAREDRIGALEGALASPLTAAGEVQTRKTYSDTVTKKTRIQVDTFYLPEASSPADGRFLFGYNVTITNLDQETCQLVSRNWIIRPVNGQTEEVSGSGVVGRQPVLGFNESFSYSSACPLNLDPTVVKALPDRVLGSMEGSYLMVAGALGQTMFQALISPFSFVLPPDVELP